MRTLINVLLGVGLFSTGAVAADPVALWQAIEASRLEPSKAVTVRDVRLDTGMATLEIERGTMVPASAIGGQVVEMVFVGKARLVLEPPNDVEAGQLELFTDQERLDEAVSEAVLVVASDAAVDAVLGRESTVAESGAVAQAEAVFDRWRARAERRLLGVDTAMLRDAVGDPVYSGYFAGWFKGETLGEFLYLNEPDADEPVKLGQFTPLDASEKEKRKLSRELHRAQRKGRLIGTVVDDLGQWDTWLSAAPTGSDGQPIPSGRFFEPERYELDVSLADRTLDLRGTARLHLRARGTSNVVMLEIASDLMVESVRLEGVPLYQRQSGSEVLVVLPASVDRDARLTLEVTYAGALIEKGPRGFALRDTTRWYPHVGSVDLAPYDLTLRWPEKLDLVASGEEVATGSDGPGRRFVTRRVALPTLAVSFEVGRLTRMTRQVGHVAVALSFDGAGRFGTAKGTREEILDTVADSLLYFEEIFGPYPLDTLEIVTVARPYSQSLLGFMTLSALGVVDDMWASLLGVQDRRTLVAHEMAHQWWGHLVPWKSYRDQWISEAMANYAAVLYTRHRLPGESVAIGPTTNWERILTRTVAGGRTIESLGPLVMGERLFSSRSSAAYQAIVYQKGALVVDMLAQRFREDHFVKILHALVKAVDFRPVSTEDFVMLIERLANTDLDGFARQYIFGTGLPEVYYTYDFTRTPEGTWVVEGEARQQSPWRYRYSVIERPGGSLDVRRERLDQIEVAGSSLVVPVQIAIHDPSRKLSKAQKKAKLEGAVTGNAIVRGRILLEGETTTIRIPLDFEPKEVWLDKDHEIFGQFFNAKRHPKRQLYDQGVDWAAAGDHERADDFFRRALAAEVFAGPAYEQDDRRSTDGRARFLDCLTHYQRARLDLDRDDLESARGDYQAARKLLKADMRSMKRSLERLEARLLLHEGDAKAAYKLLRYSHLLGGRDLESMLLLAIAARATGNDEQLRWALGVAREYGANVDLLESPDA